MDIIQRLSWLFVFLLTSMVPIYGAQQHDVILVVGAPGDEDYAKQFQTAAETWRSANERAQAHTHVIGLDMVEKPENTDKETLHRTISATTSTGNDPLWIVLIGHGTYDGRTAKFNLRGPDVAAEDLSAWLKDYQRPVVLINTTAASAPFLRALSHPGRVIITATKSGNETNATRFGGFFAEALGKTEANLNADLDHDGQVSVLELFLNAAHAVDESYKKDGLLATEHALIDDNGDGRGTRGDWFQGVWAVKTAADGATADGIRAHQIHLLPNDAERNMTAEQRQERDRLESELAVLRMEKKQLTEDEYYRRLEEIMVRLARVYQSR